jgi:hypothetical protein
MEQILESLDVVWTKAQEPCQEITAEVIYNSSYICFTLNKIVNTEFTGDVYRLTTPPYPVDFLQVRFFIDKLAYSGLRFMYNTNEIYTVSEDNTRSRLRYELFPVFETDDYYYDEPHFLDDDMFESAEEIINNYTSNNIQYNSFEMASDLFDIGLYFKYWDGDLDPHCFRTDNRWVRIGMILLIIAKENVEHSIAPIIIYVLDQIISKLGATADIEFMTKARVFAEENTTNQLLALWKKKLLNTIHSHNRIFYEI